MIGRRLTVAVIDDHADTVRAIVRVLRREFDAVAFTDPAALLNQLVAGKHFDAIVSDVWMPVDGASLYELVRSISADHAKRMVFVTGGGLPDRLERFIADKPWILKPVDAAELATMIRAVAG